MAASSASSTYGHVVRQHKVDGCSAVAVCHSMGNDISNAGDSVARSILDDFMRVLAPCSLWRRPADSSLSTPQRPLQPAAAEVRCGKSRRPKARKSGAPSPWFLVLTIWAWLGHHTGAMKVSVDIPSLPWFWTPILPGVGLSPNATVTIKLQIEKRAQNAYVLFFNEAQFISCAKLLQQQSRRLPFSNYVPCEWRASLAEPVDAVHAVKSHESGRYWLGIMQAIPNAVEGLSGEVSFLNSGGEELQISQKYMASAIIVAAWLFFGSAALLFAFIALRPRGRSRLHGLILATLIMKCCILGLVRQDIARVSRTGSQSIGRVILWRLLGQVEVIMEIIIFYVIGLGWKITRSHLRTSEWAFAATIAILSFFLGSFEVACTTFAACTGQSYLLTQFTLHSLCFLVVIVATNFNIFQLQRQISEALATPETGVLYTKYYAYCWFRGFFLLFIIIPSITQFLAFHVLSWEDMWVVVFVKEFSHWLVQTAVLLLFRPGPQQLKVFELAVVESSDSESTDQE